MTVNRNEVVTIPKWLVIVLLPMLIAGITSFGFFKANNAKQEEKMMQTEKTLLRIDDTKVDAKEFKMLQDQLNRIENKLDQHISNNPK